MYKVDIIAGARPNFVKIASLFDALKNDHYARSVFKFRLIHTGQHYDSLMSESFFEQLQLPEPDYNLGVGGGSQAEQTGNILIEYEKLLSNEPTDLCIVVGDVNSTMACAITAKKCGIKVAHIEAGIRSQDSSMPEEINRVVTDALTDFFFTTTETANSNLVSNGVPVENIFLVGNTMIDTLRKNLKRLVIPKVVSEYNITRNNYFVTTLHRPANVDDKSQVLKTLEKICEYSSGLPVIFPVHPRTKKMILTDWNKPKNLYLIDPLPYLEFIWLIKNSIGIITDSGGISEEATVLNIPCLTLRDNTERPETILIGTNKLIGTDAKNSKMYIEKIIDGHWKRGQSPPLWDGKTGKRIIDIICDIFDKNL